MTTLTWLHLSDWHQKGKDFDRQVVRDALIKDIENRAAISPDLGRVDFVVFSGDLAFSGKPAEYEIAKRELLDQVLEDVGLEPSRLFIVPGNHDLDREYTYEMLPPRLQKSLCSDAEVQTWLTDDRKRERALEPFEAYSAFVSGYTGQSTPEYATIRTWTCGGKQVALLGLNSAWMCARHKDDKGEVDDARYILVGEPQIHDTLKQIEDADVRIAVLHHPFDWLAPFDRARIEVRLGRACHFILRGHEHQSQVTIVCGTDGNCVIIPAGACYKRRIAEDPRYTNAYNWVHLDFETGQGTVYLRRWSDPRNAWIKDTDAHPGGKFLLPSLPKDLVKPAATAGTMPVMATVSPDEHRLPKVEKKYRCLLLETCDIISLVGLPEQDRHIVQRQLALRSLFIPLHTWVEAPVNEELDDPDTMGERFETLERRRETARRGFKDDSDHQRERAPIGARLKQARRLVILGDPGAGKTTLTRWIATAYLLRLKGDPDWREVPAVQTLPDADYLPIIIRCRDFKEDKRCLHGALEDILAYTLRRAEFSTTEAVDLVTLLRARLEAGTALLMLDGLDEITDPQARACFCEQVERMAVAYKAPIIVTSRIVGYREMGRRLGRAFEHLTLADLTPEEKDDFARRWCELTELPERRQEAAEEFIRDLHSSERIERLTGNPMLLTTMALVKRKVGKLPNRRADLYWEAVQVLLNWRPEVDTPLDPREAIPQLEYLAYAMCDCGVQRLRRDEALDLLTRMRKEYPNIHTVHARSPEDFLQYLEARTGIFIEAGYESHLGMEVPVYEFRHLTFQEYLAARALVDGRFPARDAKRSLAEHLAPLAGRTEEVRLRYADVGVVESWREVLRLCLAICKDDDVDPALRAILTPQEGEPAETVRARAIQAAFCLADEPNASEPVVVEIMQIFAAQVGNEDGLGYVRTGVDRAAMDLASTRWGESLRCVLLDELFSRSTGTRWNLGGLVGMVMGVIMLAEKAARGDWWNQQVACLREGDENEAVSVALGVMDIAYQRQAQLVPGLIEALLGRLSSGSAPMAHAAAWTLAWLNGGHVFFAKGIWSPTSDEMQQLLAFLRNRDSDPYAVRYLTWIIKRERITDAAQTLLFWLENPIADVRRTAAEALGRIGDATAIAPLSARLEDSDKYVCIAAAEALGRIGDATAIAPLIARLEDADSDVRRAVAYALDGLLYSQGCYEEAEAIWRQMLAKDEKRAYLWNRLGGYYQQIGRLPKALEAHRQAVSLESENAAWQFSLAGVLRQLDREQEAAEHLDLARATLDKEDDYNKACCEAIAGNTESALEYLVRALKQNPIHVWAARDPDLIWLHGDPRFEALVAGVTKTEQRGEP